MAGRSARILLVDDEEALLRLMKTYLERLGHEVTACSSANDALQQFQQDPGAFELLVVDLTMPEMSGQEMFQRMLAVNEGLRVIVCSGYPFEAKSLEPAIQKQVASVQKPFLPNMLAKAIDDIMKRKI